MTKFNAYKITDVGHPPSFKNGRMIVQVNGKPRLVTRADRQKWMIEATRQLERQRREKGLKRAEKGESGLPNKKWEPGAIVRVVVWWDGKGRLSDPDGMLVTIMDCLVKAGVLADDSPRYVKEVRLQWLRDHPDGMVGILIDHESDMDVQFK